MSVPGMGIRLERVHLRASEATGCGFVEPSEYQSNPEIGL